MNPIISIKEARKLLGKDAVCMTDAQIEDVISTLDLLAKDSLEQARRRLRIKRDATAMAELIYDVYQDKKKSPKD